MIRITAAMAHTMGIHIGKLRTSFSSQRRENGSSRMGKGGLKSMVEVAKWNKKTLLKHYIVHMYVIFISVFKMHCNITKVYAVLIVGGQRGHYKSMVEVVGLY